MPSGPNRTEVRLTDGQTLSVGKLKICVIHTPGHTPGSVCFLVNGNLFTGDTPTFTLARECQKNLFITDFTLDV